MKGYSGEGLYFSREGLGNLSSFRHWGSFGAEVGELLPYSGCTGSGIRISGGCFRYGINGIAVFFGSSIAVFLDRSYHLRDRAESYPLRPGLEGRLLFFNRRNSRSSGSGEDKEVELLRFDIGVAWTTFG